MLKNKNGTAEKRRLKKTLCLIIAMAMFFASVSGAGSRTFAAEEGTAGSRVAQLPGFDFTFVYDDAWFAESSDTYNPHLATLSMLQVEESGGADSARAAYEAMGFEDIQGNDYFNIGEDRPNSIQVLAGHKTIPENGKETVLIGLAVADSKYDLEWAGNFIIGKGGLHEGFMAARDEALRFLKKYIFENGISGRVKLWVTGHSRFGGVANLVAAYFAEDEGDYISEVSIDPEDIYAYTYAAPNTVVEGKATKGELLSVAAARTDGMYADDTPGNAYTYDHSDGDTVLDPGAEIFRGIHNVAPSVDVITMLPSQKWNFTTFGTTEEQQYIKDQNSLLYYMELLFGAETADAYRKYGGPENFKWMTFDLNSLSIVEDTSVKTPASQKDVFRGRVDGMHEFIGDQASYVDGHSEEVLSAVAGLFGSLKSKLINVLTADKESLIKAGAFTYISYVKDWFSKKKNISLTDAEAVRIVVTWAFQTLSGETIDPATFTVDDFLYYVCKYFADNTEQRFDPQDPKKVIGYNHKTKLAELLHNALAGVIAKATGEGTEDDIRAGKATVYSMLRSGAYGDATAETVTKESGKSSCAGIYVMIGMGVGMNYPQVMDAIADNGEKNVLALAEALLPMLMKGTGPDGSEVTFNSVGEAADAMIGGALTAALNNLFSTGVIPSSGLIADQYRAFVNTLVKYSAILRNLAAGLLFYSDGDEFDMAGQVRSAVTVVGQASAILQTHYQSTYMSWLLSQDDMYPIVLNSVEDGNYEQTITPELTGTEGAVLYYTTDGTDPTEASTKYTGPIELVQKDKRQEITLKVIGVRNGKTGRVWEYNYVIEGPVRYEVIPGDGSEWQKGKKKGLSFMFRRSCHDEKTGDMLTGITVDEKILDNRDYSMESLSHIVTLKSEYLETLAIGRHEIAVMFSDGDPAIASFTILEKEKKDSGQGGRIDQEEEEPETDSDYSNEWVKGKWYEKNGKQIYQGIGSWRKNKKGWWYEDTLGWYPKNRWMKIDGLWYFFNRKGYMASYEFVKGYWIERNGSQIDPVKYSWHRTAKGWWYGVKDGWYAKNQTLKIDGTSYHFNGEGYCTNP